MSTPRTARAGLFLGKHKIPRLCLRGPAEVYWSTGGADGAGGGQAT
jgi:hypothetical protein